ncbi:replication protein A 70 kDa DNA-binding subunit B-like [Apium graveolens]|uniref:replication protein A 70 kDa DNA-binding subunit B-like n=1 Tax=Apium graveolens TaxID=4045 RepID=UPI003D7B2535
MESVVFNLIEDLDQSTTNWTIKVRVTRMWTSVSFENGSVKGYNVILLDDDNNHVHAFAYPNIWNGFKTPVIEGGVYIFNQFSVKDVFDVIGVFEDFEPLTKLDTKFGMRDIVKFRICDSSNRHKVSVWGDLDVLANNIYTKELQSPAIAIITSTKVITFMNTVQIGTLPSSKLYLNLDDESVNDMRMRLKEEGYLSKREKYLKAKKSEFKRIYTTFSVVKVDEDVAWWFYSCNKCQQEVERLHRRFRCNNCPRIIPVAPKRFCMMVLAEDDTFSCNVMLMDQAARRIVGTSAAKAYNDFEKAPEEGLPQVLKDLVGKEVTVIIQLNKANVTDDSTIFDANDIFDTTMRSPSPSESAHISESSSINFSVNER